MHACAWRLVAVALAAAGATVAAPGADLVAPGPPVVLPTYTVREPRLLPPPEGWRYGQVPGFEILSDAPDGETRDLIRNFLLFQRAVGEVWPAVQRQFDLPVSLILCSHPRRFAPFVPSDLKAPAGSTYSLTLRERELAAIVLNLEAANPQVEVNVDGEAPAVGQSMSDYAAGILRGEYVHFLLSRIDPPPPPWLEAGLGQLLLSMILDGDRIGIPAVADTGDFAWRRSFAAKVKAAGVGDDQLPPLSFGSDENLRTAQSAGAFQPLLALFRQTSDTALAGSAETAWGRECYQFVYFCLFGQKGRWQKGLVAFVLESSLQPPDEALFQRCFGAGSQQLLLGLWACTDFATGRAYAMRTPQGGKAPEPPPLALRAASDAEAGRIKGDALRMAGHREAAHYSLIAPYLRGSRDPQLLAALGLEESEAARKDRAVKFLEAAVAARTTRARAYYELARLREEAARAKGRARRPVAPDRTGAVRLSAGAMASILRPLWDARSHPPPLPEIYELFATAWSESAVKPARGNLAVVDEGVRFFPFDLDLIYADARLRAQYGFNADAAGLADGGLSLARGAARDRFLKLKASLQR